ncbi:MAG: M1 family metallopeptidase [Mariniblastus sp.]|nr:M1 family metallopeptidase [Mariniblastus sp.]
MSLRLNGFVCLLVVVSIPVSLHAQAVGKFSQQDKFRQLEEDLPTPNGFRTGSGAPGPAYWQQEVNYEIDVRLDDENQRLFGSEVITYKNNSPDTLRYLWLQLDANIHRPDSESKLAATSPGLERVPFKQFQGMLARRVFDGGITITKCTDNSTNQPLKYTVVKTMMRVDLPQPLPPGGSFEFGVDWYYRINDAKVVRGRSGYEYFPEDGNYIYEMAQWFPRLCAYTDVTGWQHKQFLGRGEFTLEVGNYVVRITVPSDHVVASTGTLMNADQVLSPDQRQRLEMAKSAEKPLFIVTPEEALANESSRPDGDRTWIFKADQVRDFAFASSRKFIWDALQHDVGGAPVMAMSFYPKEGEPLWSRYSTHAIVHTLNVYSRYTFDYPYPVAISVNGPVGGMEYPMICFNGPRPEKDGTYSARTKYGLISVIIHEVGHNYFPMIVNTDERQWTWMDEGLNTFLQFLAEQEWEEGYPSRRGEPADIVPFMASLNQVPIMTNSESILQFGANAYAKPATALNILRETILGRELFDFAFKEYARRWKFKRPMPADFFRTMEDASGTDLDWFWRGWFYSTDHVDLAVLGVRRLDIQQGPEVEKQVQRAERQDQPETQSAERNKPLPKYVEKFPELKDFYNDYDPLDVTPKESRSYDKFVEKLSEEERKLLDADHYFYLVDLENVGGLVMPVILELTFEDGSTDLLRYPAEIWNKNNEAISKLIITEKPVASLNLDPRLETADVDLANNHYPPRIQKSRFELFKESRERPNPMRDQQIELKRSQQKQGGSR